MSAGADLLSAVPAAPAVEQKALMDMSFSEVGRPEWSPEAQRSVVQAQVKAGDLTEAQAAERLAPLEPTKAELDSVFPRARPEEYVLPPLAGRDAPMTTETLQFNSDVRGWLSEAGFPKEIGSSLVGEIVNVDARFKAMAKDPEGFQHLTPAQQKTYEREQRAVLHRMWGSDVAEKRIALAAKLIDEADEKSNGRVVDHLIATGAIFNANVLAQIAMHAERLQARGKAKE